MSRFDRIAVSRAAVAPTVCARPALTRASMRDAMELTKPRITKMVLVTTAVGFTLAAMSRSWGALELFLVVVFCMVGTALSASGANALNQWMERSRDADMPRTSGRPLPAARMTPGVGLLIGALCSITGVAMLWLFVNPAAAMVSLVTIVTYLLLYTPMKPVTPLATLVGAVPGALPPLIGWAAAQPTHEAAWASLAQPAGWSLFFIMLVWQIPHFLAIAWMYRGDYALGGYRVLPVVDPSGERTAAATLLWALALLPISLAPIHFMPASLGWGYAVIAVGAGAYFGYTALRFAMTRSDAHARRVFFASIIYLPLTLVAMVVDAVVMAVV
ncbi:MAG: protoheme IX farnesyltransferase [Phycisphaeraceae bacterium]|nr:MAG: protoheme IX farnesyltransferase [Phycisphaeraceae bacterium]